MVFARRLALVLSLTGLPLGCQPKQEVSAEPKKVSKKKEPKEGAKTEKAREAKAAEKAGEAEGEPGKFIVPFAYEAAKDEPLAQTRAFLGEMLQDNQDYMTHGDKFFAAFADKQTPRATVITCADSRVHTPAWDVTPENDDFMIRNIGNQVENAEGSIEYGIEHLRTPLLLVIGHTGCGAVKAAMGDTSKLSPAIQAELQHVHVPKPTAGKPPETAWAEAVIVNVNNQVETALKQFSKQVQAGQLTVVGAVLDFRNDLQQGAGKVSIVNVNGNSEPERMAAFVDAIAGKKEGEGKDGKDKKRGSSKLTDTAAAAAIAEQIAKLGGHRAAPAAERAEAHARAEAKAEHAEH
ncbi:MAG TPA: carbonic anhydrase [Polyangiaceae bacterium]|nr:carbonic anhydrase [Polyangiaceae bacterium]